MAAELKALLAIRDNPARPFACVIGGAKVSTKIGVLERLIDRLDTLVIGGAMAFTFLKAAGSKVGRSLVEDNRIDFCRQLINEAERQRVKLILPEDVVCAAKLQPGVTTIIVKIDSIPDDEMGLDLGPQTMGKIKQVLKTARTIFWNGPLGAFETPEFARATFELIDLLGDLTQSGCTTVVGGGDSVAALELKGDVSPGAFSHVSTGGGASLELIEGRLLPGVVCLDERASAVPS